MNTKKNWIKPRVTSLNGKETKLGTIPGIEGNTRLMMTPGHSSPSVPVPFSRTLTEFS